jgi:hypothetical protein
LKTTRQELDILNAYEETGEPPGCGGLVCTTHKTVKRVLVLEDPFLGHLKPPGGGVRA